MINELVASGSVLLAEFGPNRMPENNPEWGKAAPTGLFVLLVFVVVCFFLFRSMNRHMRKVPTDFSTGRTQEETFDRIGEASTPLPLLESVDLLAQTPPRLGTPAELESELRQKRIDELRKAKDRKSGS